ncbi:MAG: amidohydrolase, partial [Candidatus Marinimicrobia bacterium]|nr:amidohydrolase [Candidatus Neomarinimicrobiota bacterium]
MTIIEKNSELHQQMVTWRHHLHKHPELSFNEKMTSDYIASILQSHDIEIHRGLAVTGIVATVHGQKEGCAIGLRADMDALPIQELNDFSYKSVHDGKMHACGHDGHSTMLLGAVIYLKENNDFSGTIHFIFQPAEEGGGGG